MLHLAAYAALIVSAIAVVFLAPLASVTPERLAATMVTTAEAQGAGNLKYMGLASCAGTQCHSQTARKEPPYLNENKIWEEKDHHSKAYKTLTKATKKASSPEIAKKMGIAKATESDKCLVCHAVNVKKELRGPKFDLTEGVHCDGCHGPAEKWLEGHKEKGWTHEKSVSLGMYDTKSMLLRADKCVSCHLAIDADMVAAGHPELNAFELATFSQDMPPHWRDKGQFAPTTVWATGQVVSLREAAKQLGERAKGTVPPERLAEAAEKVKGHGAVVKHIFAVVAPDAAKALETDLGAIGDGKDKAAAGAAAGKIVAAAAANAKKISEFKYDGPTTQKLMSAIATDAEAVSKSGYQGANQAAMALDRLYSAYAAGKQDKAVGSALDKLFAGIEDPKKYDAGKYAADLKAVGGALPK
jgi:hypothetical protein